MAPCFYVQHFFLQQHKRKRVARTVFLSASYQRIQIKTRQRTLCKQINSRWTCPKGAQCKRRKTASKQSPVSAISTIVSLKGWKRKELKENINKERKEKKIASGKIRTHNLLFTRLRFNHSVATSRLQLFKPNILLVLP